ncbi:SrfA family protein [Methylococcus sp. ANG]|uniref:SrfA family protein n=1 Tax=Methylococcus sp. ANG TaxID=3231903 RepID=UPI00345872FA
MAGVLLRSGSLKHFLPLGATGNPVYRAASQLRAAIRRQLGQEAADHFAVPVQDEKGDTIDWYSAFDGDVVPWTSATPEERGPARASLLAARERLLEKSRALQASEDSEQQVFGKLLALATRIPGEDHVYLVGGRPVMTFWGFGGRDEPPERDVLASLDVGGISVSPARFEAGPGMAPPAPERRRWWRWLWLLLPLLLLGFLLFGLRSCGPDGLAGLMRQEPTPSPVPLAQNRDAVPEASPSARPGEAVREQIRRGDAAFGERSDQSERHDREDMSVSRTVDGSRTVGDTTRAARSPEGAADIENRDTSAAMPPASAATDEESTSAPEAESADADMAGTESSDGNAAKSDSGADGQTADASPSEGSGTPADEKSAASTDQPAESPSGQGASGTGSGVTASGAPLTIPKEAARQGSTDFLNGQWHSVTGLQDSSGNPVQLEYDFKGTEGMARLKRSVGGKEMECTAPVTSSFSGSKLVIDQAGDIRCPDGSSIQRSKVECATDPQGHAVCKGKNPDGSDYNVRITKK